MALPNTHPNLGYISTDTKNTYLYPENNEISRLIENEYIFANGYLGGTTTWMEANNLVLGNGENISKLEPGVYTYNTSSWTISGYGQYVRDKGYSLAHSVEKSKTGTIYCFVRSIKYTIDARDNETTLVIDKAGRFLEKARNEHLLPEMDAYRLSSLFNAVVSHNYSTYDLTALDRTGWVLNADTEGLDTNLALARVKKVDIAQTSDIDTLNSTIVNAINFVDDSIGGAGQDMLLILNQKIKPYIRNYVTDQLEAGSMIIPLMYGAQEMNYGWNGLFKYNGEVLAQFYPSQLMKTAYTYKAGMQGALADYDPATDGGGFTSADTAKDIIFMYIPMVLPEAKIFYEVTNVAYLSTEMDSWQVAHRIEHDIVFAEEYMRYGVVAFGDITAFAY